MSRERQAESECDLKKQSQSPAAARKSEARNTKSETRMLCAAHLKKQSQFSKGKIDVILATVMVYGDFDGPGRRENIANQSQSVALEWFREKNLLLKFRGSFRYMFDGSY
jgi:hypothetical protein